MAVECDRYDVVEFIISNLKPEDVYKALNNGNHFAGNALDVAFCQEANETRTSIAQLLIKSGATVTEKIKALADKNGYGELFAKEKPSHSLAQAQGSQARGSNDHSRPRTQEITLRSASHYGRDKNNQYNLAIEFPSKQARNNFVRAFNAKADELNVRKMPMTTFRGKNKTLYIEPSQPVKDKSGKITDYIPGAHKSPQGQLAVNFGNNELRNWFAGQLGITTDHAKMNTKGYGGGATIFFKPDALSPVPGEQVLKTQAPVSQEQQAPAQGSSWAGSIEAKKEEGKKGL